MKRIEIHIQSNPVRGGVLLGVLVICTALLVLSAALFSSLTGGDRITHKSMLRTEAREGAEAALALATAEINRRAVAFASFGVDAVKEMDLNTGDVTTLVGTTGKSNLVAASVEIQPGYFSMERDNINLRTEDPAYSRDDSKGITVSTRYGRVQARASVKDPVTGTVNTSYVEGLVQLRERAWFNYGFFFNMDMEVFPGPPMHVYGAVHTNADLYLGSDGNQLYLHKMVTAAGHIYRGIKYCLKAYNADGSITGFENKPNWGTGSTYPGEGTGRVYCTKNNLAADVEMLWNNDCLGTKTSPTANLSTWIDQEKNRWSSFVMDKSLNVDKFSPPALPLYVPENYETSAVTELRNHGYAMIEPQLPYTSNVRYYGRKSDDVENLKWSALAGLTIVVDDYQRAYEAGETDGVTFAQAANLGYAIPWKLVWYTGSVNDDAPIDKENLPKRGPDGLPVANVLDPFALNDEVDAASATDIKMQRNLKALLRDAIVVVPYYDSGGSTTSFGTGTTSVTIQARPSSGDRSYTPTGGAGYRYKQPANKFPFLNKGDAAPAVTGVAKVTGSTNTTVLAANTYAADSWKQIYGLAVATDRYPARSSGSSGYPNPLVNASTQVSGLYDRRQGYNGTVGGTMTVGDSNTATSSSTDRNVALTGAMHVVYIDLQKLNWILNHPALWLHPTTGTPIYTFDKSYNNIIYVDLPSDRQSVDFITRSGLSSPDNICHAQRASSSTPGYAVMLTKGGRLPRLPLDTDSGGDRQLRTPGFTLATNGPLYIKGNFNADGERDTGSSLYSDQDSTGTNPGVWYGAKTNREAEIPALVAADCVMFLSEGFRPLYSNRNKYTEDALATATPSTKRYHGYGYGTGAGESTVVDDNFLEISTAIVTGLTPTIPDRSPGAGGKNQQSGAVNNLPRFLEGFSGSTVRYRGSMAALYDCEVLTKRFIQNSHGYWFDPPNRDWGYHAYFAAGNFPPGTPVVRSARLMNVKEISSAQYTAGPQQPN